MSTARVLIVDDGRQRGTLEAVRCLGRSGHTVLLASAERGHAARSRFCSGWTRITPTSLEELTHDIASILRRERVDVLFAGDDQHLLALSEVREQLSAVFPYAPHHLVVAALDKLTLHQHALEVGLGSPETSEHPPVDRTEGQWLGKRRLYADDSSHEIVPVTRTTPHDGSSSMVYQRVVQGSLFAIVALCGRNGEIVYAGAQRADTLFPEPFGVSARAQTVPLDDGLRCATERLLRRLQWWGLAELQFVQPPDGEALLIDLNGRFFGSMALTSAAGVDLPSAWVSSGLGLDPPAMTAQIGTRYQWLEGDLRRAVASRSAREVWRTVRYAPGAKHSVWTSDDPQPAATHVLDLLGRAKRNAAARGGR